MPQIINICSTETKVKINSFFLRKCKVRIHSITHRQVKGIIVVVEVGRHMVRIFCHEENEVGFRISGIIRLCNRYDFSAICSITLIKSLYYSKS